MIAKITPRVNHIYPETLTIKAPTLFPFYSNPYTPIERNPLLIIKALIPVALLD